MKNRIKNKLRSRAGASITFALLLFLVCSVLCSVVLTAATSSSGRMSQIAEADQRYYAVTSAAELLESIIDGKTVSIVKVENSWSKTTYSAGVIQSTTPEEVPEGETASATYIVADKTANEIDEDDLVPANLADTVAIDTIPKDAAKNLSKSEPLIDRVLTLDSTFYNAEDLEMEYDSLAVTIQEDLDLEGNIKLKLFNRYKAKDLESTEGERYTLTLVFGADKSETTGSKTENVSSSASSSDQYEVVTKTTTTTITSLTWNLIGINTNS